MIMAMGDLWGVVERECEADCCGGTGEEEFL